MIPIKTIKESQRIIYITNFYRKTISECGQEFLNLFITNEVFPKIVLLNVFLMSVYKQNWTLCDLKKQKITVENYEVKYNKVYVIVSI